MTSKPGFPKSDWTGYSYASNFVATDGTQYPGHNSGGIETFYRDKTGANTPGWPHRIQSNFYMTYSSTVKPASIDYDFNSPFGRAYGTDSAVFKAAGGGAAGQIMSYSWPYIVQLYDEAQAKMYNRLISQLKNQKVNYAQVYAERAQTADLVISTAKKLAESFINLRKGNFFGAVTSLTGSSRSSARGLRRVAGGIPEQWLALQYGWKPLLSDIYGSAEELARYHNDSDTPPFARCTASGRATGSGQERSNASSGGDPDWIFELKSATAKGIGNVVYSVSNSVANAYGRTGLTNPLQLAWELLPYSFIVDWFYPVGNYLSQLDYSSGLIFESGWENMKIELSWSVAPVNVNRWPSGFTSGGWTGGKWQAEVKYFQRLPTNGFPSPQTPRLKDPFSPTHVANALSLLATAFSGTSRIR
jgi:hypothetical protein